MQKVRPINHPRPRRDFLRLLALSGAGIAGTLIFGCSDDDKKTGAIATATPVEAPPSGFFDSDGVRIHYETWGQGRPIVLVHGFSASLTANWVVTGWVDFLKLTRRVIALDCRGHGESDKPHEPEAYGGDKMGGDVLRLLDYLDIEKADLFGYSMGGYISAGLLADHQERFNSVIMGGVGDPFGSGADMVTDAIAEGLLAPDASTITDPLAKGFRVFAESNPDNDLQALAACLGRVREPLQPADFADVNIPALIVNGTDDVLSLNAQKFADAIPGAVLVQIDGRDHLTVVPDQRFKDDVMTFLNGHSG